MEMFAKLLPIWIAYFAAASTPGPSQVFLVESTTLGSPRQGRIAALGVSLGTGAWVLFVALGLNVIFESFESGRDVLRVGSAMLIAYFLYKSFRSFLSARRRPSGESPPRKVHSRRRAFVSGFLVNLINPNSAVFFLSLLAPLLTDTRDPTDLAVCVAGVMIISVIWYQSVISMASIPRLRSLLERSEKWMRLTLVGVYFYFLIKILSGF